MIEFIIGRSAGGKSTYLDTQIAESVEQNKEVCLIVPEQESMMTERRFQQLYGERVQVLSFHRLCDTLMRLYGGGAKPRIGDVAQMGILFRAVQSVKSRLVYYRKSASSVRFYEKLVPVIEDFAAYKADENIILPLLENTESYSKYKDLFLIYEAYNALRLQDYRNNFDDLDTAVRLLGENDYFSGKSVLIDHFAGFTEQEYAILENIFLTAGQVMLTLTADESENMLFSPTLRHLYRLRELADRCGLSHKTTTLRGEYRYQNSDLQILEKYLFSAKSPSQKAESAGGVRIFEAGSVEDEVRLVGADIRRRVLSGECSYKDISVVSNVTDEYQHTVEMIFDEMDIPLYSDRKVDVLSRPLFSMILHAFDAVQYGYRFEDMFSLAKTYLCGLDYESVSKLENYVFMWNIRGKKWESEWVQSPFGLETPAEEEREEFEQRKKELLDEINGYRRHLMGPLTEFAEDTATGKATDLLAAVWRLLENFKVTDSLKEFAAREKKADRAEQWIRLHDLLIEMLDQLALVLGENNISRKELHDMMEVCLRGYRFGVTPAFMDQVHFGDMIRAHSGEVKHLYVLGAAHGKFPAAVSGSAIITDRDIRRLEEKNILLSKDSMTVALEQQFCLYRSISGASDSVTFSLTVFAGDGAPQLPSALLGRISEKLLDIEIKEDPHDILHYRDLLRLVAAMPTDHPQYAEFSAYLKEYFNIDPKALRTRKKEDKDLPRHLVEALYGKELSASQSRLESFVGCPFHYFLDYGLGLKESEPVTFAANDIGDFVHHGLECLMNAIAADDHLENWDEARVDTVLSEIIDTYFEKHLEDMSSPRFDHLFDRICRALHLVAYSALDELKNSDFFPAMQEYRFDKRIPLGDGFAARVNGYIDRVDCAEIDGQKWMKIVDYKTGDKRFKLDKIYNGYQLQLPLYTSMLHQRPDFSGHKVAGMEYFLAGVPEFVDNDAEMQKKLAGEFIRHGLFRESDEIIAAVDRTEDGLYTRGTLATERQMDLLETFVERKLISIMKRLSRGDVSVCPMKRGVNACQYCAFDGICRFEYGKNKVRTYSKVKKEEFFDRIEKEES
ncbi:MAG: PD-(D/E)XK nuclease family protein [Clostridia bacterium]|nr:PD-(D/E)XK nuclease family protein [Clostridia bacterium]